MTRWPSRIGAYFIRLSESLSTGLRRRQCLFAPWLKAHFWIDKLVRGEFDLEAWKIEHTDLVRTRARELEADRYRVSLEDQNAFKIRGQAGTLAGTCDLIAERGDEVLIVDAKSGQSRSADVHQVLIYLFAVPVALALGLAHLADSRDEKTMMCASAARPALPT